MRTHLTPFEDARVYICLLFWMDCSTRYLLSS